MKKVRMRKKAEEEEEEKTNKIQQNIWLKSNTQTHNTQKKSTHIIHVRNT